MNPAKLLIGILSFALVSCAEDKPKFDYTGFVDKQVFLIGTDSNYEDTDTLALLSMKIPQRLDTFYKWHHYSDCANCGNTKYRFADKSYPQFAEDGFYWTVVLDSAWQLSIWHKPFRVRSDTAQLKELTIGDSNYARSYYSEILTISHKLPLIERSFRKINGRSFFIEYFKNSNGYLTNKETLYVIAATNLKDRHISFIGECSAKDTSGFFSDINKTFESIQIEERAHMSSYR